MSAVVRDPARERELREAGFTVVRLLSGQAAARLRDELLALSPAGALRASVAGRHDHACHATFLEPDEAYRRAACAAVEARLGPPLAALLTGYRRLLAGFVVKPAGAGEVGLHRDWTMTADPAELALNVWCPLVDVDADNGALALVPGSHRIAPGTIEGPGGRCRWAAELGDPPPPARPVALRAGEALLYDSRTLHRSSPNLSGAARPVATATYIPEDARPAFFRFTSATGPTRAERYDMAGDAHLAHSAADYHGGIVRAPMATVEADAPAPPRRGLAGAVRALLRRGG